MKRSTSKRRALAYTLNVSMAAFGNFLEGPLLAGRTRTTCCHKTVIVGNHERGERKLLGFDENLNNRPSPVVPTVD